MQTKRLEGIFTDIRKKGGKYNDSNLSARKGTYRLRGGEMLDLRAQGFNKKNIKNIKEFGKYAKATNKELNVENYRKWNKEFGTLTERVPLATRALNGLKKTASVVGSTFVSMAASMAISAIIGLIVNGIRDLIVTAEEANQKAEAFTENLKEIHKTSVENKKSIAELEDEYYSLSKGVDNLGNK